ncbi:MULTISPECIES: excisionase [Atlantibacter]|uniref:Excisionase-like domain-containing protein n=2 Tax=Atlantibacter TaxID=1903434 RepID=H5UZ02_ATLHE|nr:MULTISPECIES: excisionase [Atlantibacter]MCQ4966196.1 hypothetical protein [Enterobacteriaceae bacterium DFI.7.85]QFH71177.1 hypothetical protein FR762_16255 [Enterobacter sp. E76]MCZ7836072.1 hypothetical protein [Atlantibacter hermannii]MDA3133278.1 hypothetical protein [Atlantibacter subterranea]MDU1950936.1 excisionase [Atlantibacter hermannii]
MGQLVAINEWASGPNGFKEPISRAALHKIAKTRQTYPPAIKQGRRWVVDEDARFIGLVGRVEITSGISDQARQLVEKALNGCPSQKTQY